MSNWWDADPVESRAPTRIPVSKGGGVAPEGFLSNPRGFSVADVQAAVRGDMFNSPGLPIKYEAQPGQTFGQSATANAQPIQNIVAHHTGGPTLDGALSTARRGDPFRSDVKYGYHFYIDTDGTVVQGAPMDARTNHVQPPGAAQRTNRPDVSNNNSIGVSFVGTGSNPTPEQLAAAQNLSRSLMGRYGIQPQNVVGHGEIQSNRQTSEGMPLVEAIRGGQAVAQAPQSPMQMGASATAAPSKSTQAWWSNDPVAAEESDPTLRELSDMTNNPRVRQEVGRGRAAYEGALAGASLNFGDEIYGASKASGLPEILGGFRAPIGAARLGYESLTGQPGAATKAYEQAVGEKRGLLKDAQEQHGGYYTAGNVAGSLALPVGIVGQAATLPGRVALGSATGAVVGGLSGAGEGENLADRASKGAVGTVIGAGIGAVAPPLVEGAIQAGRSVINPAVNAVRGAVSPEAEASRRVVSAIERDFRTDPNAANRLTPQEFAASRNAGGPARVVDLGGETTKSLARSAANTSPEGRQVLNTAINDRYEGQTGRISDWLNSTFHYPNADAQQQAITQVASTVNRGAYARAYRDGDRQLWSPELERLTSSPDVVAAMREAATKGKSRAVTQGFGGFNAGVTVDNGVVNFQRGANGQPTYPNLQFWDYTKRALDDMGNAARRAGRNEEASTLTSLSRALRSELDTQVPTYGQARAGAAQFFGAENALEAGQNFVRQNFNTAETRRTLARMSPAERQLFQDGFVSRYVETINQTGDRRNVLNQIAGSPAAREKLNIALGPQRSAELEAGLRVEGIMDMARGAVQGNSTTARQLTELGLAGGAAGAGGYGLYNQDPSTMTVGAISAALLAGKRGIDTRVARQVATMLASDNPQVIQRGIGIIARNGRFMDALRTADSKIARVGGVEGQASAPALQSASTSRAEDQPGVPRPPGQ